MPDRLVLDPPTHAPLPRYPLPYAAAARIGSTAVAPVACLLDVGAHRLTVNARMALAQALRLTGVRAGDEVLLPAWHCPTMVHPVLWLGAVPRFYRLQSDWAPDIEDLARRINPATRAVVAVHFFGHPVALQALATLCRQHGLPLIEDCAHALLGGSPQRPVGRTGDYAVSSLMKFLPVVDGGCLVAAPGRALPALYSPGPVHEARALVRTLERAIQARPGAAATAARAVLGLGARLRAWPRTHSSTAIPTAAVGPATRARAGSDACAADGLDGFWVDKRMSLASRHLLAGSQWDWQAQQRRHHHRLLREALQDLPRVRLLEPAPDSQAVPYVGALLADTAEHGDRIDRHLQAHGVPVMRWLDLAVDPVTGPDPDATDRARRLLQLPCHQSLQDADLHRIARLIRQSAS
ncbi:MAG: hypothetical protein RLY78_2722 [Pseudomonadota bacterium]